MQPNTERQIDDKLIAEIAERIAQAFHPRRIVLFGSRARGDARPDSDIDLMVEMEFEGPRWEMRRTIYQLFTDRWWPMDLLVYTPKDIEVWGDSYATILPDIQAEGKVLYAG
jgi:predicted nucleotidyltransferase